MQIKSLASKMGPNDLHIVVNGEAKTLVAYTRGGTVVLKGEAHCYGQHADWTRTNGDTPPGIYRAGVLYDTQGEAAYGRWCLDLEDLENQETGNGRAGISIHGGGSNLIDPFAPYQGWLATHGCVRLQNAFLEMFVSLYRHTREQKGTVYVQVYYPKGRLE